MTRHALCLLSLLSACQTGQPTVVDVQVWGSLHSMMQEGSSGPAVGLETLLPDSDLWAVGALSGLRGEITVLGGEAYLSYPSRTDAVSESREQAALLVASRVQGWTGFTVEEPVDLEALGSLLRSRSLSEPVPFRVEGPVRELGWHVIDGLRLPPGASSPAMHRQASVLHEMVEGEAELLGFYSTSHGGVFTHMGSDLHVHCVVPDPLSSGHVDRVTILPGAMVYLPSN